MPRPIDRMSTDNLHAVLEYLREEAQHAETQEELQAVVEIARDLISPSPVQNAVRGIGHIRAEYARAAPDARGAYACTVRLEVPHILSTIFRDLSERMKHLQHEDPATFANATSALNWLANGNILSN